MDLVRSFAQVHEQLPDAHLHIAGETHTEPAYVESIRQWIKQSKLDGYVHFLGSLPEEAIFQEFSNCSVLVLPSAQETAPMVIAQAMAAGKPVVATRVGGVAEMVGEDTSRGFLVNVGDINAFSTAVTNLLQNPDLQSKMGQNGRAFAQENYHLKSVARHTNEVYHRIVFQEQKAIV
jgi:glycosyltransferase involved in cell wall biosynthesis